MSALMRAARAALCGLAVLGARLAVAEDPLAVVERAIAGRFSVDEVSTRDLDSVLATSDSSNLLLFDVREVPEFERSRLRGARRVAADMKADAFAVQYGEQVAGKRLIFYCSVGYRSSLLAERVREQALATGALSVANLRGGIFRWYNEGRAVHDDADTTDAIHPYDRIWGVLVNQRDPQRDPTPVRADALSATGADSTGE